MGRLRTRAFCRLLDLTLFRVGDDFYMTASSFNCSPGLPILHSQGFGQLEDHRARDSEAG